MDKENVTQEEQQFWDQFRAWITTNGNDASLPKGNKITPEGKQEFSRKIPKYCGVTLRSGGKFGHFKIEFYVNPEDENSVFDQLQESFRELERDGKNLFDEITMPDSKDSKPVWSFDRSKMKKFNVVLPYTFDDTSEENWPAINNRLKQLLERFCEVFGERLGIYQRR